ncbi:hypothetical protein JAAARDRAFT_199588 [Jaapia argillacea MUCL 33604]|uniref:BTB domain-containing protein n=1 Tax=Jaapia argillacea MUCL 33604 TaxID=933084 RepID=A0A067PAM7_9AGAM|nr:hypothetical protein JAAARDRAFT_199588 [Jaapia argillacea MUCL 33604]
MKHVPSSEGSLGDQNMGDPSRDIEVENDPEFFFENMTLLVEGQRFQIPRRYFENDSEIFRGMFSVPVPEGSPADGSSIDHPLRLEGVRKDDFRQLLRVMYPRQSSVYQLKDKLTMQTKELPQVTQLEFVAMDCGTRFIHDVGVRSH